MSVIFREDYCKQCGLCIEACPKKILSLSEDRLNHKGYRPVVCREPDRCTGCALCARTCPDVAIEVYAETGFTPAVRPEPAAMHV